MFESARETIYQAIASIRLIDPHTHINPHNPGSQTLADILGYHYYTELVHSAGMPKSMIEEEGIGPRELVRRLVQGLPNIENTANYQWLINICQTFFDFGDDRITEANWEGLYDAAEAKMSSAQWPQMVLDRSNVEAVFLTNDFDDDLEGFDTNTYIPCLRTDDLVFHLGKTQTRERLAACSGIEMDGSLVQLRAALEQRFQHFVPAGARACAISIPPDFVPTRVSDGRAETALNEVLRKGTQADKNHQVALSRRIFWTLAELCDEYNVPFDLMIGVNRGVYPEGVYQGQDLYDSRVSLTQYRDLFNAFPEVKFPISVLASVTNQELVSHAWIFPNVITNGHWWYSNTPSFIQRDTAARLEAVPRNKQVGYYSDAYKLEFVLPKFDMYRRILADVLANHFVGSCGWSEEQAIDLGYQVLRGNVDAIFPSRSDVSAETIDQVDQVEVIPDESDDGEISSLSLGAVVGAGAALTAGAIGTVEVHDAVSEHADQIDHLEQAMGAIDPEFESADQDEFAPGDVDESTLVEADSEIDDVDEIETFEEELPDLPTESGATMETVEIDQAESVDGFDVTEQPYDQHAYAEQPYTEDAHQEQAYEDPDAVELDPLPSEDEISAVDVADVELQDFGGPGPEIASIEDQLDAEPLDVGNLLDQEVESLTDQVEDVSEEIGDVVDSGESQIRMLQGDLGFVPDEDSLQLDKDPVTGELRFGNAPAAPQEPGPEIPTQLSDPIETLESMIQETVDLNEIDDDVS